MANASNWGPNSTGYVLPTLQELIDEEKSFMLAGNPNLTFPAGSKDLVIVEKRAKARLRDWEARQCEYASQDPCNATGCQLDNRLALLGYKRLEDETDEEFIARWKSSKGDGGWITKIEGKISNLDGVCRVKVWQNTNETVDEFTGLPGGSYEVVFQGGDPKEIAKIIWECSTGCKNIGTDECVFEDENGVCRRIKLTPAVEVPMCIRLRINTYDISCGCTNQTETAIKEAAIAILTSKEGCGRNIGDPIYAGILQQGIAIPGIGIEGIDTAPSGLDDDGNCTCDLVEDEEWVPGALNLGPRTIPTFDIDCICVLSRDL